MNVRFAIGVVVAAILWSSSAWAGPRPKEWRPTPGSVSLDPSGWTAERSGDAPGDSLLLPGAPQLEVVEVAVDDTLQSLTGVVTVRVRFRNAGAPLSGIAVAVAPGEKLESLNEAVIPHLATSDTASVELQLRPAPLTSLSSEGTIGVALRASAGDHEDLIPISIPVWLPGWHSHALAELIRVESVSAVRHNVVWGVSLTRRGSSLFRTTDGRRFEVVTPLSLSSGTGVRARDDRRASVYGSSSRIFSTTDGGATWSTVESNASTFINGLHWFDDSSGVALGDPVDGVWGISTSSDGGSSWHRIDQNIQAPAGSQGYAQCFFGLGDRVWFGTNVNRIYRSTDRGRTWESSATGSHGNAFSIAFADSLRGVASFWSTTSPGLMRTSDGGASWADMTLPIAEATPWGLCFIPGTTRLHVATSDGMFFTDDFGVTWTEIPSPSERLAYVVIDVGFDDPAVSQRYGLWCGGEAGLWSLDDENSSTTEVERERDASRTFDLGQNLPNPAKAYTTVPFALGSDATVALEIYDLRGERLRSFELGAMSKGEHSVPLETASLPVGRYLYVVRADGESRGRHMSVVE